MPRFQIRTIEALPEVSPVTVLEQVPAAPPVLPSDLPPEPPVPAQPVRHQRRMWGFTLLACGLVAGIAGLVVWWRSSEPQTAGVFQLRTVQGEFRGIPVYLPQGGVELGPAVSENDEMTVRLRFSPEQDMHHAGLLIWDGDDTYVKFGRRFQDRSILESGYKENGRFHDVPNGDAYDFEGQTGAPIWLSIRRQGRVFYPSTSADGVHWSPFGTPIEMATAMKEPRLGIFAINGRREAVSVPATLEALRDAGWTFASSRACSPIEPQLEPPLLQFRTAEQATCSAEFLHALPPGDATVSTRLDFVSFPGSMSGLVIWGDKGGARIAFGEDVRLFFDGHYVMDQPDWRGKPPLFIRLKIQGGILTGSYSRDDVEYRNFAARVPVADLGGNLRFGLRLNLPQHAVNPSPPGIFYLRREIQTLEPLRTALTNEKGLPEGK